MHSNNLFGSSQGGAFQATGNPNNPGLFELFGQQTTNNQPQTSFQSSTFVQPAMLNQPPSLGSTVFGQTTAFGQNSAQSSTLSKMNQTPAFGQSGAGFSSGSTPAFGQRSGSSQTSLFGQTPAFGQTSAFGQPSGLVQQSPGFGLSAGMSQAASGSSDTIGSSQSIGFGQSPFGQQISKAQNVPSNVTQSTGFGSSDFTFKPIFSVSPEPVISQITMGSSQPFGTSGSKTSSSTMESTGKTTTGFSLMSESKSGLLGFSFSQPAAASSISAEKDPLTASNSIDSPGALQFTFSQPAAPSSSNTSPATEPPTTPSSFSFSAKVLQPQTPSLLDGATFSQTSAFGDPKVKSDPGTGNRGSDRSGTGEGSVFARLGKGTKRKDDPASMGAASESPTKDVDLVPEADAVRQAPKRPLLRTHGPVGLFSRAVSGLLKPSVTTARRGSAPRESQQVSPFGHRDIQAHEDQQASSTPRAQAPTREVLEKAEDSDMAKVPEPEPESPVSARRNQRSDSSDSLPGVSPGDGTVLQCKNVPVGLNKKEVLEKHFSRFGKVRRIFCRPNKNLAIVHFHENASAAKAKKKGKVLHRHELLIFWQKKRNPGERRGSQAEEDCSAPQATAVSSPIRRAAYRSSAPATVAFSRSSPMKRPAIAKTLLFDTEAQQESSADTQCSERPVLSSLLHLVGHPAETAEERYRLLEQRDKILRQGRTKRTDLNLSKVFVGTCPDMCPEKERYMRETRNQLSSFEVIPNSEMVDHMAAIKEYSRSSADQEEPLPHELRPLPVLCMTMDYLVTQIMDQYDDNYRDWYDFVWNRTRGIRKDITQQHLCCPHTVSLIEKCTRFHIHCAHQLCEEPMMTFDTKINNENMTKCLQSLKEMYHDLGTRQIHCPREAEFRQYNVLLKLNDGDILREVQQFRDDVRNSPEVKFAVQAFAALNSNNFVRFFKLVKAASYLASCLLHRYFNQVRTKALRALNIAHTVGSQRSTTFPLEDMVRLLMFRSSTEATDFILQYGLNISDGVVELSRTAYQEPELPLAQKKENVILAKTRVLIGEVVNGGPLPSPPHHTPVCSFDINNKYRGEVPVEPPAGHLRPATPVDSMVSVKSEVKAQPEALFRLQVKPAKLMVEPQLFVELRAGLELDESGKPSVHPLLAKPPQLFQPVALPQPTKPPSPPKPEYSDEDMLAEVDTVVEEVVRAAVRDIAGDAACYASVAVMESSGQAEALVREVVDMMLQEISAAELRLGQEHVALERRRLEEARRRQEREAFLTQFSQSLCSEILQEVLDESVRQTAAAEIREAEEEKAARIASCTLDVCNSMLEETLGAEIALLVEELLEAELQQIHKFIKRWRDVVAVRRQLKRQMRGFPAAPCCVDPHFKLKALAPSAPPQPCLADLARGLVHLGNAGTVSLSSTRLLKMRQEAVHQMRVHYFYQQLLEETVWTPLDLPALVAENYPNSPERIFWKAALLLPSDHESVASLADCLLSNWLEVKLGGGQGSDVKERPAEGMLQTLCVTNTLQEKDEHTHKVHISIKVTRGPLSDHGFSKMEECGDLQGTDALLLLLPAPIAPEPGQEEQDVPLLSALLQLKQLQQASAWQCPLPLGVLVPGLDGTTSTHNLEDALMLKVLVEEGLISEYMFFYLPETTSDLQGSQQLGQAVRWLLCHAPSPLPLSCQSLVHYVEGGLSREFSSRLCALGLPSARPITRPLTRPSTRPLALIRLYNSVLLHLANAVSSPGLCSLSCPPEEFSLQASRRLVPMAGWNSAPHLAWLKRAILSLQLPHWELPSTDASWAQLCSSIQDFASQISASAQGQPLLMSRLENLLQRTRLRCWQHPGPASPWRETEEEEGPSFSHIPWDEVVLLCIDHKLKDWSSPGPPMCPDAVSDNGDILVYFQAESLKGFQPPQEWTEAVRNTHRDKQREAEGASGCDLGFPSTLTLRQKLFQSLADPQDSLDSLLDITHTPTAQELLPLQVMQELEEEKAQSQRSIEQMQCWLDSDPLEHFSTPLFMPSSTLLCAPATLRSPAHTTKTPSLTQEEKRDEALSKTEWPRRSPVSVSRRLRDIERQILASQEEELACRLKLSGMLSIIDD